MCTKHCIVLFFRNRSVLMVHISRKCAYRDCFGLNFFNKLNVKVHKIAGAHLFSRTSNEFCVSVLKILVHLKENLTITSFPGKFWRRFTL